MSAHGCGSGKLLWKEPIFLLSIRSRLTCGQRSISKDDSEVSSASQFRRSSNRLFEINYVCAAPAERGAEQYRPETTSLPEEVIYGEHARR